MLTTLASSGREEEVMSGEGGGGHTVECLRKLYLVFYEFQISYVS